VPPPYEDRIRVDVRRTGSFGPNMIVWALAAEPDTIRWSIDIARYPQLIYN
jgi:hypothetical protein